MQSALEADAPLGGRSDLTRDTADGLRELIALRTLSPGQQLRQLELAARLGVSRSPLREAMRMLEREGLLVHEPNRGYFVARMSREELDQIYRIRALLETELLTTLRPASAAELDRLRSINAEIAAAVGRRAVDVMLSRNREFHFAIFSLSPQTLIAREVERLWRLCEPYHATHLWHPSVRERMVADHEEIVAALSEGDLRALRRRIDAHREAAHASVVDLLGPR